VLEAVAAGPEPWWVVGWSVRVGWGCLCCCFSALLLRQVVLLFAALRAEVALDAQGNTRAALMAFLRDGHAEILDAIDSSGDLADDVAEQLAAALVAFQAR
jgi:hypothetical protein